MVNDMDTNSVQNDLPQENWLLKNRKRATIKMMEKLLIPTLWKRCHKFLWKMVMTHNHSSNLYGWELFLTIHMCHGMNAWHMLIDQQGNYFQATCKCSIWLPIALIHQIFHVFNIGKFYQDFISRIDDFVVAFNAKGPLFIHPETLKIFGTKNIGKTPAWTIAHCLEWLPSTRKHYCFIYVTYPSWAKHLIMHI